MLHYYLKTEIKQNNNFVVLSQSKYVKSLLNKFNIESCNSVTTPMEIRCVLNTKQEA